MMIVNTLIAIVALLIGAGICYLLFRFSAKGILRKAEEEAEVIKKNKIIWEYKDNLLLQSSGKSLFARGFCPI